MIIGNSNCSIAILEDEHDNKSVLKFGDARLSNQGFKQLFFKSYFTKDNEINNIFSVPQVGRLGKNFFEMEYIDGDSITKYIEQNDEVKLESVISNLFKLIRWEFQISYNERFDKTKFEKKIDNLNIDYEIKTKLLSMIHSVNIESIPVGYCHGDLTFSNMIINDKIVLFDFLDTFYESPYQDLAKILQEVNLRWAHLKTLHRKENNDINQTYQFLRNLAYREIDKLVNEKIIDENILHLFYFICIARIIPYTENKKIMKLLNEELLKA